MTTRGIVLLALVCMPAASGTPFEQPEHPDAFLAWNDTEQLFDLYLLDGPLITVDDPGTRGVDDRSLDVNGEPYDASRYQYTPRQDHMRFEDPSYPDGYLDARIVFPEVQGLAAVEWYPWFMHLGVQTLVAYGAAPPCGLAFTTMAQPVGARITSVTDFWVFAGAVPGLEAWWGTMTWCQ